MRRPPPEVRRRLACYWGSWQFDPIPRRKPSAQASAKHCTGCAAHSVSISDYRCYPAAGCRRETLTSLGPLAAVKTACECTEPESASAEPRLSESQPSPARRKVKGVSLVLRGTQAPPTLSGSLRGAQTDMRLGVPLGYSNGHSSPTSHTPGLGWESPTSSTPYWP